MDIKNKILNELYKKFYLNKTNSEQTSSFWEQLNKLQIVSKTNSNFELGGCGFGEFIKDNFLNNLKNIPSKIFIKRMLRNCDKEIINDTKWISKNTSRLFTYDLARQALILNKLKSSFNNIDDKTFCIIGDGYGALVCIIKKHFPNSKIISVNLGKILYKLVNLNLNKKIISL